MFLEWLEPSFQLIVIRGAGRNFFRGMEILRKIFCSH